MFNRQKTNDMPDYNPQDTRQAGMEFLEAMEPVLDMLDGYRSKLRSRGYSEAAVEHMCVQFHESLIHSISKSADK